ncbi:MAG TPA: hypothetical protein VFW86_03335, partial [Candidatus Limnocylindrales bacterium]|nr:hypothetical protein [Candidatus Limnocylindrales bacterium]
ELQRDRRQGTNGGPARRAPQRSARTHASAHPSGNPQADGCADHPAHEPANPAPNEPADGSADAPDHAARRDRRVQRDPGPGLSDIAAWPDTHADLQRARDHR